MINKNLEVLVSNRGHGVVGYTLAEMGGLNRQFQPGEVKRLTFEELEKLSWIPGGRYLLENELIVDNKDVIDYLLHGVEPEYYYGEKEVKYLLTEGSLDQLLDCLDFAPAGVIELVKEMAVSLPCNDVAKRQAILDKTGYNVTNALEMLKDDESAEEAVGVPSRRSAPVGEEAQEKEEVSARRAKYVTKK